MVDFTTKDIQLDNPRVLRTDVPRLRGDSSAADALTAIAQGVENVKRVQTEQEARERFSTLKRQVETNVVEIEQDGATVELDRDAQLRLVAERDRLQNMMALGEQGKLEEGFVEQSRQVLNAVQTRLTKLESARKQGILNERNFRLKARAAINEMKAATPGFSQEIDQTASEVFTDPAFRMIAFTDFGDQDGADDERTAKGLTQAFAIAKDRGQSLSGYDLNSFGDQVRFVKDMFKINTAKEDLVLLQEDKKRIEANNVIGEENQAPVMLREVKGMSDNFENNIISVFQKSFPQEGFVDLESILQDERTPERLLRINEQMKSELFAQRVYRDIPEARKDAIWAPMETLLQTIANAPEGRAAHIKNSVAVTQGLFEQQAMATPQGVYIMSLMKNGVPLPPSTQVMTANAFNQFTRDMLNTANPEVNWDNKLQSDGQDTFKNDIKPVMDTVTMNVNSWGGLAETAKSQATSLLSNIANQVSVAKQLPFTTTHQIVTTLAHGNVPDMVAKSTPSERTAYAKLVTPDARGNTQLDRHLAKIIVGAREKGLKYDPKTASYGDSSIDAALMNTVTAMENLGLKVDRGARLAEIDEGVDKFIVARAQGEATRRQATLTASEQEQLDTFIASRQKEPTAAPVAQTQERRLTKEGTVLRAAVDTLEGLRGKIDETDFSALEKAFLGTAEAQELPK
jgi:hypothetical protein